MDFVVVVVLDDVVATRVETRSDARERELVDAMLARCAPGATTMLAAHVVAAVNSIFERGS